jgi:hypothetical protein
MDNIEEVRARFKVFLEEHRETVDRLAEANTIRDAEGRFIGVRWEDDDFDWESLYPEFYKKE